MIRSEHWRPLGVLILVFAVSRVVAALAGVRFADGYLGWYWQFVDIDLLRNDLGRSLFYLHAQPPLFNLIVGVVLKLFPGSEAMAFKVLYLGLGVILCSAGYLVLVTLDVGPRLAAVIMALFIVGPACLLYENYLFYTYPTAILLLVAVLPLVFFLRSGRLGFGVTFFLVLATICLVRSVYHLVWLVGCLAVVAIGTGATVSRRRWAAAFLPAFLLVSLVYGKNLLVFGAPSSSTWLGMSLYTMTSRRVDPSELEALNSQGAISELHEVFSGSGGTTFAPLDEFPEAFRQAAATGVPVLDRSTKQATHPFLGTLVPNFNHLAYIEISRQYWRDSVGVVMARPSAFFGSVAENLALFARPSESYLRPAWSENAGRLAPYTKLYGLVFKGSIPEASSVDGVRSVADRLRGKAYLMVVLVPVSVICAWRTTRRVANSEPVVAGALLFMSFNVLFTTLVANTLNFGESHRMFFLIEPTLVVLFGVCVGRLWQGRRSGRQKSSRTALS